MNIITVMSFLIFSMKGINVAETNEHEKLEAGVIYSIYKTEEPVLKSNDPILYNNKRHRVSKDGNNFLADLYKCPECGYIHRSKIITSISCHRCLADIRIKEITIDRSIFDGIKNGFIYVVYENEKPIKCKNDILIQRWRSTKNGVSKKCFKVSRKGNIFKTRISICDCGVKMIAKKLKSSACGICRKTGKRVINYKPGDKSLTKKEVAEKRSINLLKFEEKCREITDCIHRLSICLIKYQNEQFLPCHGCKDYVKLGIEGVLQVVDGFNVEKGSL